MRSKETIQQELTETRTRLSAYLAREADMLSKDGVQLYTIGSRNLQRYQTSLASVQDMIAKLQSESASWRPNWRADLLAVPWG